MFAVAFLEHLGATTGEFLEMGYSPPSQRQVVLRGQFAGQRLNPYDQLWGGKTGGDPVVASLQVPAVAG